MIILFKRKEIERRVLFPLSLKSLTSPSHREKERASGPDEEEKEESRDIFIYLSV
jgi:hypothetical protein